MYHDNLPFPRFLVQNTEKQAATFNVCLKVPANAHYYKSTFINFYPDSIMTARHNTNLVRPDQNALGKLFADVQNLFSFKVYWA